MTVWEVYKTENLKYVTNQFLGGWWWLVIHDKDENVLDTAGSLNITMTTRIVMTHLWLYSNTHMSVLFLRKEQDIYCLCFFVVGWQSRLSGWMIFQSKRMPAFEKLGLFLTFNDFTFQCQGIILGVWVDKLYFELSVKQWHIRPV